MEKNDLWKDRFLLLILTFFLFMFTLLIYHPGFMSEDSFAQLIEARSKIYSDGHPPIMAFIWGIMDRVVAGPFGMLAFQLFLYWAGLYLITFAMGMRLVYGTLFLGCVGLYFGTMGILGVIWKDVLLMSSLVVAIGSFLMLLRTNKKIWFFVATFFIYLGCAFRINGVFAMPPLLLGMILIILGNRWNWYKRLFVGITFSLLMSFVFLFGNNFIIREVLKAEDTHAWKLLALYDIAGTYHFLGYVPQDFNAQCVYFPDTQPMTIDILNTDYDSRSLMSLISPRCTPDGQCRHQIFAFGNERVPDARCSFDALKKQWIESITSHPFAYLRHRISVFKHVIGLTKEPLWAPIYFSVINTDKNIPGLYFAKSGLQNKIGAFLDSKQGTLLFRIWFFLILNLGVVFVSLKRLRQNKSYFFLPIAASALFYELGYLFLAPSSDYRYSLFFLVGTLISIHLLVRELLLERNITSKLVFRRLRGYIENKLGSHKKSA